MFCSNCGKQNMDGAKFCAGCGTPMMVVDETIPVQQQTPVYATDTPVAPAPQKPNKNKKGLIIGIVVGVIVVIVAVIGILFATGVFETDSDTEDKKIEETNNKKQDEEDDDVIEDEKTPIEEQAMGDKVEFGKVSIVVSDEFEESEFAINNGKMFTFDDYPTRTDNFTIEDIANSPGYVTEADIQTMYSYLNLDAYELVSFDKYSCDGYEYTRALVEISMSGMYMRAELYVIFVDEQCVMMTFNSVGKGSSDVFAKEIASIRVNGKALGK